MSRVGGSPKYRPWTSTTRPHELALNAGWDEQLLGLELPNSARSASFVSSGSAHIEREHSRVIKSMETARSARGTDGLENASSVSGGRGQGTGIQHSPIARQLLDARIVSEQRSCLRAIAQSPTSSPPLGGRFPFSRSVLGLERLG
jgi:hypothetical protein